MPPQADHSSSGYEGELGRARGVPTMLWKGSLDASLSPVRAEYMSNHLELGNSVKGEIEAHTT